MFVHTVVNKMFFHTVVDETSGAPNLVLSSHLKWQQKIRSRRYFAYNTASKLHSMKFLKRLINLRNLDNAISSNNSQLNPTNAATNMENNHNTIDTTNLVTDLTGQLNSQETDLPSKGPKFSPSPAVPEHTVTGINVAFFRLANQIRWKLLRESNPQPSNVITYPQTRHIYRPSS